MLYNVVKLRWRWFNARVIGRDGGQICGFKGRGGGGRKRRFLVRVSAKCVFLVNTAMSYLLCSLVAWGMEQSIFNPRLTRDMLLRVRKELDLIVTLNVNRRALARAFFMEMTGPILVNNLFPNIYQSQ